MNKRRPSNPRVVIKALRRFNFPVNKRGDRRSRGLLHWHLKAVNTDITNYVSDTLFDGSVDLSKLKDVFIKNIEQGASSMKLQVKDFRFTYINPHEAAIKAYTSTGNMNDDIKALQALGLQYVPAILWLTVSAEAKATIRLVVIDKDAVLVDQDIISKAFFSLFVIWLMTANYPVQGSYVPKMLLGSFGSNWQPVVHLNKIFSCNGNLIDLKFLKSFDMTSMPQIYKNRFALSIAGYRIVSAIAGVILEEDPKDTVVTMDDGTVKTTKTTLSPKLKKTEAQEVINACIEICAAGPDWAMHPSFRPDTALTRFGSINRNGAHFLAYYASKEYLAGLVASKSLFAAPLAGPIETKFYSLKADLFNKDAVFTK